MPDIQAVMVLGELISCNVYQHYQLSFFVCDIPRQDMTVDDASVTISEILTLFFERFKALFSPRTSMFVDLYSTHDPTQPSTIQTQL